MVKNSDWLQKNANRSMRILCSLPVVGKVLLKKLSARRCAHPEIDAGSAVEHLRKAVLAYQTASVSHLMYEDRLHRINARLQSSGEAVPDESFTEYSMMQEIWLNAAMANSVSLEKLQTASELVESTAESLQIIIFNDGQGGVEASNDAEWNSAGLIGSLAKAA